MKDTLTHDQIAAYREQGFLMIEGFFNEEELSAFRASTEEAVERRLTAVDDGLDSGDVKPSLSTRLKGPVMSVLGANGAARLKSGLRAVLGEKIVPQGFNGVLNTNQGDKDSYYAQVYVQCIHLAAEHESLRKIVTDSRIGKVVAELAGIDGVRLYHDQALYKPVLGNPTAWHLDNPYWAFYSRQSMTMWVALEDATLKNGCMCYIPGSHLTATNANIDIGQNFAGLFKLYPDWKQIDPVACPAKAGSVVFHSGLTAHGAGVNMTNRPRKAFACAFMPEGAIFNGRKDVLPEEYFKSLKIGDVLNNDEIHPLIWKRGQDTRSTHDVAQPELVPA